MFLGSDPPDKKRLHDLIPANRSEHPFAVWVRMTPNRTSLHLGCRVWPSSLTSARVRGHWRLMRAGGAVRLDSFQFPAGRTGEREEEANHRRGWAASFLSSLPSWRLEPCLAQRCSGRAGLRTSPDGLAFHHRGRDQAGLAVFCIPCPFFMTFPGQGGSIRDFFSLGA